MKKSVFLSPTFSTDVASMPGEIEIACSVNYQKKNLNCKKNVDSNTLNIEHNNITEADVTVTNSHHMFEKDFQLIENFSNKNSENVADGIDMFVDNSRQELNTKIMKPVVPSKAQDTGNVVMNMVEISDQVTSTDDHPDEAYSSDCNINNPELAWLALAENSTTQANCDLNNKISVISEQIHEPSHFKELKYLHNHNSNIPNFLPIPINSSITTNKLVDDDNNQKHIATFPANANEPQQNCASVSKEINSTLQNNFQNSETILMFDDKGVIINAENYNGTVDFPVHIVANESLTLDEKYTVGEEILGSVDNSGELNADSNFDVCIDFNVSDIEKHLEENEEILESFVNEITGSDAHIIIENLENSEEASCKKACEVTVVTDVACAEFESNPVSNISQLKSYQNHSNQYEIVVHKLASPGDCFSNNNSSTMLHNPSHIIEKVNMMHGSALTNQNASRDDALQGLKYSISKESENKFLVYCNANQNIKNNVKSESSCALSVTVSNNEINKKQTCEVNTVDISNYNDQFKNDIENETSISQKSSKKETNVIGKKHDAKESTNSTYIPCISEQVEEIAMLLRQITRRRSESAKALCQKIDHKWSHAKCEETYKPRSKMHIHGVEKPGGSGSVDNNISLNKTRIKTYRKSMKPKQTPKFTNKRIVIQDKSNIYLSCTAESSKYDQERTSIGFCLCKDFGSLTHYDDEGVYEHIHFLDHKKIYCDSQYLFSIYNEEEIVNCEKIVDKDIEQESPSPCALNICWTSLLNKGVTEVENPDRIDKVSGAINNISDFSSNINLNTEVEQKVQDEIIIKSSQGSNRSSVEIPASVRNEIKLNERIPVFVPICETGSSTQAQMIESEAKTVSDQVEHLNEVITEENMIGTKVYNNPTLKHFETYLLTENVDVNCSKVENEDSSLRPVKVRKSNRKISSRNF